jgi:hypothetical protein
VSFTESEVEEAALQWFGELAYARMYGPDMLPDEPMPERDERTPLLEGRLCAELARLHLAGIGDRGCNAQTHARHRPVARRRELGSASNGCRWRSH